MSGAGGNYFAGMKYVEGLGFVEGAERTGGNLAGEADVMMISGLGATEEEPTTVTAQNGRVVSTSGSFSLGAALGQKVKVLGIELPLWAWVLIAAGALGAGWVFFGRKLLKSK